MAEHTVRSCGECCFMGRGAGHNEVHKHCAHPLGALIAIPSDKEGEVLRSCPLRIEPLVVRLYQGVVR